MRCTNQYFFKLNLGIQSGHPVETRPLRLTAPLSHLYRRTQPRKRHRAIHFEESKVPRPTTPMSAAKVHLAENSLTEKHYDYHVRRSVAFDGVNQRACRRIMGKPCNWTLVGANYKYTSHGRNAEFLRQSPLPR